MLHKPLAMKTLTIMLTVVANFVLAAPVGTTTEACVVVEYAAQIGGSPVSYSQLYLAGDGRVQWCERSAERLSNIREITLPDSDSVKPLRALFPLLDQLPKITTSATQGVVEWAGSQTEITYHDANGQNREWRFPSNKLPAEWIAQIEKLRQTTRPIEPPSERWIIALPLDATASAMVRQAGAFAVVDEQTRRLCPAAVAALSTPHRLVPVADETALTSLLGRPLSERFPAASAEFQGTLYQLRLGITR